MQCLEGETLARRFGTGTLPLDQALTIAIPRYSASPSPDGRAGADRDEALGHGTCDARDRYTIVSARDLRDAPTRPDGYTGDLK